MSKEVLLLIKVEGLGRQTGEVGIRVRDSTEGGINKSTVTSNFLDSRRDTVSPRGAPADPHQSFQSSNQHQQNA